MNDALAIANLKACYCAASDLSASDAEAARQQLMQVFTPDFFGDYGMATFDGPAAMADFLCTAIGGNSEWMIHHLTSPHIEIAGETATGEWAVLVHSKRRDGERMEVVGRYRDQFRRTAQGWKISRIEFRQFK